MKVPTKLNILGQEYKVIYCKTEKDFLKHKDAEKSDLGLCCKMEKEIWLNVFEHNKYRCSEIRLKETLLHEIGHAIMEESGLSYGVNEVIEEVIVDVFSKAISKLPKEIK